MFSEELIKTNCQKQAHTAFRDAYYNTDILIF